MNISNKIPFYVKSSYLLLKLAIITTILYFGHRFILPVVIALLFSILLRPLVRFFSNKLKFPHVLAVLVADLLFIFFIGALLLFISRQISGISNDWDQMQANLYVHFHQIQQWVKGSFNISYNDQMNYIRTAGKNQMQSASIGGFTEGILTFILIPFYIFLFLLYRNLLLGFLFKFVDEENHGKLKEILFEIKTTIQHYLVGILFDMGIVSTLVTVGFMIVGVPYALLLGVITGILNLIPYIGILIATLLSIIAAPPDDGTGASAILGIVIVNVIVHLLDNNVIIPLVVSSKVKINALVSVLGVVMGGAIAGIAGMFLAIPILAILKVIFDRIESLEPWGFLLGDNLPKTIEWNNMKFANKEDEPKLQIHIVKLDENNPEHESEKI
jgi:predicted PurR-regulated permease PerM